jgi:SNF2 family DNA or RNA helicase
MKILQEHQRKILGYTLRTRTPALFLDMRLGKTVITVRRVSAYPDCQRVLIACPYSAFNSWIEELQESHQEYVELIGTREERLFLLKSSRVKWHLINKEGFLALPEIAFVPWDCVIADESTFLKNPTTQITKFFTKNFRSAKYRWILTGTPNPESDLDYFCQFLFLDGGRTFQSTNFYQFRFKHFAILGYDWYPTPRGSRFIASRLKDRAYFMTRQEVRKLKEKIRVVRKVQFPSAIKKKYAKLEKDFLIDLPDGDISSTIFATEKYIWLRALASGFLPDGSKIWDGKLDELFYLLAGELKGQQVIIWASRIHELLAIEGTITPLGVTATVCGQVPPRKRKLLEEEFQAGRVRYFLAQPECYKFGANLSKADAMVYFSNMPAFLTRSQSEDRIINLNKNDPSLIIDLVTEKSVDEDLLYSIQAKGFRASVVRTMIKRMEERRANVDG